MGSSKNYAIPLPQRVNPAILGILEYCLFHQVPVACALSRTIEGKTPGEITETFHLPDDLTENVDVEDEHADDCSVEDLLSFIDGEDGGLYSKEGRTNDIKRKNQRRKDQESDTPPSAFPNDELGFDEADIDDNLDPAMTEELDREVEDFARRLNSDWPERMQEI
ncbi:hypothetical protein DKX38_019145 [Salix brachista]|uniref:Uncharacterized protein n=1 Tax=Salix brachista TaxID=2182728 RepID=A0A5N5KPZ1_9ROSI|nr:hypothetical protein DKX38_019145 [Salix brachista]